MRGEGEAFCSITITGVGTNCSMLGGGSNFGEAGGGEGGRITFSSIYLVSGDSSTFSGESSSLKKSDYSLLLSITSDYYSSSDEISFGGLIGLFGKGAATTAIILLPQIKSETFISLKQSKSVERKFPCINSYPLDVFCSSMDFGPRETFYILGPLISVGFDIGWSFANIPPSLSNIPSVFLPQTYRSPLDVNSPDDSSEHEIFTIGKDVNLDTLCGMELKFPTTPSPSYPLSLRPHAYNSLLKVLMRV